MSIILYSVEAQKEVPLTKQSKKEAGKLRPSSSEKNIYK